MHELTLCQNIINIIQTYATTHGVKRIVKVNLEIGELAAVDSKSLQFWFNELVKGTIAESARMQVSEVAGNSLIVKSMEAE